MTTNRVPFSGNVVAHPEARLCSTIFSHIREQTPDVQKLFREVLMLPAGTELRFGDTALTLTNEPSRNSMNMVDGSQTLWIVEGWGGRRASKSYSKDLCRFWKIDIGSEGEMTATLHEVPNDVSSALYKPLRTRRQTASPA